MLCALLWFCCGYVAIHFLVSIKQPCRIWLNILYSTSQEICTRFVLCIGWATQWLAAVCSVWDILYYGSYCTYEIYWTYEIYCTMGYTVLWDIRYSWDILYFMGCTARIGYTVVITQVCPAAGPLFVKTSCRQISWRIEAARYGFKVMRSLWNASEAPAKFQSDTIILTNNLTDFAKC